MPKSNKLHVIINPHAAYGMARQKWPEILKRLRAEGFDVAWQETKQRLHASCIAQDMVEKGAEIIVGVGGDGTTNEIVNGIMCATPHGKTRPELILLPIGTGADLAKTLLIPADWQAAVNVIKHGSTRSIDIGKVVFKTATKTWQRYFANVFDAGLGGNVDRIANTLPRGIGGFLTFLCSSLIALVTFRRMRLKVWVDNKLIDDGLITIIGAANCEYFGGDMHIAPMALPDDGLFEVIYVKDTNIFKFLVHILGKVYQAEHLKYHNVYHYQGQEIKIQADRLFLSDIDGEVEKAQEVIISLMPKALKIRVPHGKIKKPE